MLPMFFIVWGTKVRTRMLGVKGDFCNSCLRVCSHDVKSVEHASHVYYIHGRWHEKARYQECDICGALGHVEATVAMLEKGSAGTQSIESLITATNPALPNHYGQIAQAIETNVPEAKRATHILDSFCVRSIEEFKAAEAAIGGWVGLVLIIFLVAAGFAFALAGPIIGSVVSVLLVVALIWIRHWGIHRWVAKRLRPRLISLLNATGIRWEQVESDLSSGNLNYPKLRRHFSRSAYDTMSFENASQSKSQRCDFLLPTVDRFPLANAPQPEARTATTRPLAEQLSIVLCFHCGTQVIRKADGRCPSCQAQL